KVLPRNLPRGLETVCLKCLEKRPHERYLSPSELANDLKRILEKVDPLGRPTPTWKRTVRRVQRHPVRAALLGVTTLAVLASAEYLDHRRKGETDLLLRRLVVASLAELPELVPRIPVRDSTVIDRLRTLFVNGNGNQQLAVALVLAK